MLGYKFKILATTIFLMDEVIAGNLSSSFAIDKKQDTPSSCIPIGTALLEMRKHLPKSQIFDNIHYKELISQAYPLVDDILPDNWRNLSHPLPNLKGKEVLGRGYGSIVYRVDDRALKFPYNTHPQGKARLFVEYTVSSYLRRNETIYHIKTDPILAYGENFSYLEKNLIPSEQIASNMEYLNPEQVSKLKILFENSKTLARKTGIGLDLKDANLAWIENNGSWDWVLFDPGPRLSYRPYGFTKDLNSFEEYLRVWRLDDPL